MRLPRPPVQAQVIEEIIVTATKRETSLQDTPMSITALGEFELQRIGAEGIFDYGVKIPNLGFSNEGRWPLQLGLSRHPRRGRRRRDRRDGLFTSMISRCRNT